MRVNVRFFAALRERFGTDGAQIELDEGAVAADAWREATGLPLEGHLKIAVNQAYASAGAAVRDGDEVAFFPPVTGG